MKIGGAEKEEPNSPFAQRTIWRSTSVFSVVLFPGADSLQAG